MFSTTLPYVTSLDTYDITVTSYKEMDTINELLAVMLVLGLGLGP